MSKDHALNGAMSLAEKIMKDVRAKRYYYLFDEQQGKAPIVNTLAYMMGDRPTRAMPEGFHNLFGLFFAKRRLDSEGELGIMSALHNGVGVFWDLETAEEWRAKLIADGWTIYIATWEAHEPLESIKRVR